MDDVDTALEAPSKPHESKENVLDFASRFNTRFTSGPPANSEEARFCAEEMRREDHLALLRNPWKLSLVSDDYVVTIGDNLEDGTREIFYQQVESNPFKNADDEWRVRVVMRGTDYRKDIESSLCLVPLAELSLKVSASQWRNIEATEWPQTLQELMTALVS